MTVLDGTLGVERKSPRDGPGPSVLQVGNERASWKVLTQNRLHLQTFHCRNSGMMRSFSCHTELTLDPVQRGSGFEILDIDL